ncbi:MAG TPA: Fe-Mn family superoxide dismutase [Blastocatellia bacterium]|nr:Fe-Mn family superoxide dismutase [Blastocatellia bacterium]
MKKISRRSALGSMMTGAPLLGATVAAQTTNPVAAPAKAFRGEHKPKPLPFDPTKLKGISEKLIKSHWENNYSGAVGALNVIEKRLAAMVNDKDVPGYVYADLKREELVRTGSVVLHELYFANLGGDGKAGGKVLDALKDAFGSFEQWEADFRKTAQGLAGGSGWVILAHNFHTGELHNYWAWDHMHNAPFSRPLLALDMYEHSYHMDYGSAAAKYIDAFMQNVQWQEVERRFVNAQKLQV